MTPPGFLISAPSSGTGKTMLTLGLARAFRDRGVKVRAFKSGPDYIDPAFHRAATGLASFNLDTWAMSGAMLGEILATASDADLVIAEGSMGLHDGVLRQGQSGSGASAGLAIMLGWPVVLVIDVSGQAQTAAAVAAGLAAFRPGLVLAGVVLNRVASVRHERMVRAGMQDAGIAVFGALPKNPKIAVPERHLGLVQAEEIGALDEILHEAARFVAAHVDLDAVQASARCGVLPAGQARLPRPPGQRIALAKDQAFSFTYPHLVAAWQKQGCEILPFSPLDDEPPDVSADVCWLPGGYPELHAGQIAHAARFRAGLTAFAQTRPVHGECGGYMVLGAGLVDKAGARHEMTGLLGLETSYERAKMHLGYRVASLAADMPGYPKGARLRGHEFHYSTILSQPDTALAEVSDADGAAVAETGSVRGRVTGSFFHLIAEAT